MSAEQEAASQSELAWLLDDDRVIASVELATTARTRSRGLLGREGIDGLLMIEPAMSVHTIGMKFAIDVAYCRRSRRAEPDADPKRRADRAECADGDTDVMKIDVLEVATMVPNRLGRPRPRARIVLEAQAGVMAKWGVAPGRQLQVRLPARPDQP